MEYVIVIGVGTIVSITEMSMYLIEGDQKKALLRNYQEDTMRQNAVKLFLCMAMVVMLMLCMTVTAAAVEPDTSWYSGSGPYELSDAADLLGFAQLVNSGTDFKGKTVQLTQDIDLGGINWTPIGICNKMADTIGGSNGAPTQDYTGNSPFKGIFDGKNYTISNMTMNYEHNCTVDKDGNPVVTESYGFFGYTQYAEIKNVSFSDADIKITPKDGCTGTANVAVVAGYMFGTKVSNVNISGVTAELKRTSFGGLAGETYAYAVDKKNEDGTYEYTYKYMNDVRDVHIQGIHVTSASYGYVCGLLGNMHVYFEGERDLNPEDCYVNCDVTGMTVNANYNGTGTMRIGGLTIWQQGRGTFKTVDCDIKGLDIRLNGTGKYSVAGAIDVAYHAYSENCTTQGRVVDNGGNVKTVIGGFINAPRRDDDFNVGVQIIDCSADVDIISENATVGGFIGLADSVKNENTVVNIENCHSTGDVTGRIAGGFAGVISTAATEATSARELIYNITNCTASGIVRGSEMASGMIGEVSGHEKLPLLLNIKNSGSSSDVYSGGQVNGVLASQGKYCTVQSVYPDANWWFTGRINPVDLMPGLPETGDSSRAGLWLALMAAAGALLVIGKRRAA